MKKTYAMYKAAVAEYDKIMAEQIENTPDKVEAWFRRCDEACTEVEKHEEPILNFIERFCKVERHVAIKVLENPKFEEIVALA